MGESRSTAPSEAALAAGPDAGEMPDLVPAMGLGAVAVAAVIAAGVARIKLVAIEVGPAGLGLYGQLASLAAIAGLLGGVAGGGGISRHLAETPLPERGRESARAFRVALVVVVAPAILVALWAASWSDWLAGAALVDAGLSRWVVRILPCLPLAALASAAAGVLRGCRRYRRLALVQGAAALGGVGLIAALLAAGGLEGLSFFPAALAALLALLTTVAAAPLLVSRDHRRSWWDGPLARTIYAYGGAGVATSAAVALVALAIGRETLAGAGAEAAGHFRSLWLLSESILALGMAAYHSYLYPSFCAAIDDGGRQRVFERLATAVLALAVPLLVVTSALGPWLIPLLYSSRFAAVAPLLGFYLVGDLLRTLGWVCGLPLLARGRLSLTVGLTVSWALALWLGYRALQPELGVAGYAVAYVVCCGLLSAAQLLLVRRLYGLRLGSEGRRLLAGGLATLGVLAVVGSEGGWQRWSAVTVAAVWSAGTVWALRRPLSRWREMAR